jgi:hypothetical protein
MVATRFGGSPFPHLDWADGLDSFGLVLVAKGKKDFEYNGAFSILSLSLFDSQLAVLPRRKSPVLHQKGPSPFEPVKALRRGFEACATY